MLAYFWAGDPGTSRELAEKLCHGPASSDQRTGLPDIRAGFTIPCMFPEKFLYFHQMQLKANSYKMR